jgi:hypothetical protein
MAKHQKFKFTSRFFSLETEGEEINVSKMTHLVLLTRLLLATISMAGVLIYLVYN